MRDRSSRSFQSSPRRGLSCVLDCVSKIPLLLQYCFFMGVNRTVCFNTVLLLCYFCIIWTVAMSDRRDCLITRSQINANNHNFLKIIHQPPRKDLRFLFFFSLISAELLTVSRICIILSL